MAQTRRRRLLTALILGLMATPLAPLGAQVGLQVRNGKLWSSVVEVAAVGPLTLRWKWDGVGMPTKVRWAATTEPPGPAVDANAFSQVGQLNLPAKGGVYEEFTATPHASMRLPFYVRVDAYLVVKGDAAEKIVSSRWITVRQVARAAPVTTASTEPTRATPLVTGSSEPLKTAGVAGDVTPLRITLARIHARALARTDYETHGPAAVGSPAPINRIYVVMVAIELNRSNIEQSLVRVKATPVYPVATNSITHAQIPIWGPDDAPRPIAGTGGDVLLMMALMQRYGSRSLGISEALILKGIRQQLSLIKTIDPADVKQVLLKSFAQENEAAADQDRNDRPVAYNMWSRAIFLTKIGDNLLQRAREGEIIELTLELGTATGMGSTGGRFTVVFDMRR